MSETELLDQYLVSTSYIESDSEIVKKLANYFQKKYTNNVDLAIAFFYYVRDSIKYTVTFDTYSTDVFKSTHCLNSAKSFCIPKAAALSALSRASDIPARLHFADLRNRRIPDHLYKSIGSDMFYYHCYAELFLNDKWVKATPSFDLNTCLRHNLPPVEFDGEIDGLFASHDNDGNPYCEYVNDRGVFNDVPVDDVLKGLFKYYGHVDKFFVNNKGKY
ncbi:MAG: transglutaminase domain-containing protein [Candidatus Kariarchaeaceae archaeon]|jgi:transglutaminase-like putative cysteine protease